MRLTLVRMVIGVILACTSALAAADSGLMWRAIVVGNQSTPERLATVDLQRYIAQVTGVVPTLVSAEDWQAKPVPAIILGTPESNPLVKIAPLRLSINPGAQGYFLEQDDRTVCAAGFTPQGAVNAVYGLLREVGFGFYLGSEAIPERLPERLNSPSVVRKPALAIRGVLPWYNFFNSPTTWDPVDHRAFVDQLIRMGANFVGFHTYDSEPFAAYEEGGTMKYGGRLLNTAAPTWGTHPLPTSQFAFGTDLLFSADYFGAASSLAGSGANDAIRREQVIMRDALDYAKKRGLRACLGFEVNGDPTMAADRDVFLKRINHLLDTYPALDYLWIWQPETQGAQGYREQYNQHILGSTLKTDSPLRRYGTARRDVFKRAVERTAGERPFLQDNEEGKVARAIEGARLEQFGQLAYRALTHRQNPPKLVISGWGGDERLLSAEYYGGLDKLLPEDVVFASLDHIFPRNRVDGVYHDLPPQRQRWPIPWLENDGDQWHPQPWVHTYAAMFKDILASGSQGVLGIHWRTREVEENFGYLVAACWQPDLTAEAFFADLAKRCYPESIASQMAAVHSELDRLGYRWVGGTGQNECAGFSWGPGEPEKVKRLQQIRERFDGLLPKAGRSEPRVQWVLDRIDWVLAFQQVEESVVAARDLLAKAQSAKPDDAKKLAADALARLDDGAMARALHAYARRVTTRGEYGVLATINTKAVVAWRDLRGQCCRVLGQTDSERPDFDLAAPSVSLPRLYGSVPAGHDLQLEAAVKITGLAPTLVSYRAMGADAWKKLPLIKARGTVFHATIPAQDVVPPGIWIGFVTDTPSDIPVAQLFISVMPDLPVETSSRPTVATATAQPDWRVHVSHDGRLPVEISWDTTPQADYFKVLRDGAALAETAVPFLADSPERPEVTYTVEAWRDGRKLSDSSPITVKVPDRPISDAPAVKGRANRAAVFLIWPAVPSSAVAGYRVYHQPAGGAAPERELTAKVGARAMGEHVFRDQPKPGKWQYGVAAVNAAGREGPVAEVSIEFAPGKAVAPVASFPLTGKPADATLVGDVKFTGEGALFGDGYMTLPHRSEWDLNMGFTLTFEFKADTTAEMPVLLSHGQWQMDGWFIQVLGGSLIARTPHGDAPGPPVEPGRWYAVRLVYDGAFLYLFIDGKAVGQSPALSQTVAANRPLVIGQYDVAGSQYAFRGMIRNVAVYPDAVLP